MNGDAAAGSPGELMIQDVVVRFGGHTAVDGLSLKASPGMITGLIGPNGAGKTTTFNVCSGLLTPTSGRVLLAGSDVTRRSPSARAQLGLGRTFQRLELFDSLTVRENVALGREAGFSGKRLWRVFRASRWERQQVQQAADDALELCGLTGLMDRSAGDLSTGQRRLVELARAVAGDFSMLLLDEPSSGLDRHETETFGAILKRLVADGRCGILLVEHDMALVMAICDYVYVLDFGRHIFEGTPNEVVASDVVRAAYLGCDDLLTANGPRASAGHNTNGGLDA